MLSEIATTINSKTMFRGNFLLQAVGCLLLSVIVAVLLFAASPKSVKAQSLAAPVNVTDAFGGEYQFQEGVCLTDKKRAEFQKQLQSSINKLRSEGKIAAIDSTAPPQFIFPVRGNGAGEQDPGFHVMGNFVDHNPAFPNQLRDYNCGTRTYDLASGYNHKGIDIINYPFAWNKMDNNETVAIAAADGQIVFKADGNFDRNCDFSNPNWNIVVLLHSDGTVSWYGHLKRDTLTTKAVGEMVTQGEFLGVVGSSGSSTIPHLHFEVYNADNQLQDPYQGPCNLMNNFSYWLAQPAYRDSSINKLMTHSALPVGQTCPNPAITNEKNVFAPGSQVIATVSYRDQVAGQVSQLSLIQPDGTVYQSWTHVSPNTFTASSWAFTNNLPANALTGAWKFRVVYESRTYEHTFHVRSTPFDFDGDGKTDISIYRSSVGEWWIQQSSNAQTLASQFGASSDKIVPADYTGDGKADVAIFRPASGEWFILRSENQSFYSFPFGTSGDIPAPADFDGDNKVDAAVFRLSTATWYISKSTGGTFIQQFGQNGDVPVVSDYDGDGKADIAIYRVASGQWWINRSTAGLIAFQFGSSSDKPVQGDYTGDGKADIALFRPNTGEWFVLRSENQSYYSFPFGTNGDTPAPGDFDGDGKLDATLFRPSANTWYSQRTTAGTLIQSFGQTGDVPVPSSFVP
jgi:murein DD-endopeptidase MepM/ murein hydrolase activator NlpD